MRPQLIIGLGFIGMIHGIWWTFYQGERTYGIGFDLFFFSFFGWTAVGAIAGWVIHGIPQVLTQRDILWRMCSAIGFLYGVWQFRSAGIHEHSFSIAPIFGWTIAGVIIGYLVDKSFGNDLSAEDIRRDYADKNPTASRIKAALKKNRTANPDSLISGWSPVQSQTPVTVHYTNSAGIRRQADIFPKIVEIEFKLSGLLVTVNQLKKIGRNTTHQVQLNIDRILNPEVLGFQIEAQPAQQIHDHQPQNTPSEDSCPSCNNSHVRLWDGKYRCWNCGYVLSEESPPQPEPIPPVIAEAPLNLPEPALPPSPTWQVGTRVVIEEMPLDTFEAAQVMRRLKPNLSPFEVLEAIQFESERNPILQGFEPAIAEGIKADFEQAGCRVSLQVIEKGQTVSEPESRPVRAPTEEEFHEIRMGNQRELINLIRSGDLDLNAKDREGYPLLHGIQKEHMAKLLLQQGADPMVTDNTGHTALHHCNDSAVQEVLIEYGIPINAQADNSETALHIWAVRGDYEAVKTLLHFGADPNLLDHTGRTPLQSAQLGLAHGNSDGFLKVIQLLQANEPLPPVIEPNPTPGRTPTEDEFFEIRHAMDDEVHQIKKLIESEAIDVNARDEFNRPLVFGIWDPKILNLLVKLGADIHAKDDYNSSVLHDCIEPAVCHLLIQLGVNPNIRDDQMCTPLHDCMSAAVMRVLIEHGGEINARDNSGNAPLHECIDGETVRELIKAGAEIDAVNTDGVTPLIEAAAMGRFDVVKTLIEHGADIAHQSDSVTDRRKTALAAAENHIWDGDRDFHRDARENCEKIAQLLREHGAK